MRPPRPSLHAGGCAFPIDPDLTAPEAEVFWTPETDPGLVLLTSAPSALGTKASALSLAGSSARKAREGSYLHHVTGGERFAVLLLGEASEDHGAGVVLLDDHLPDRFEALARFHRAMQRRPCPPDRRLTRLRRRNLRQMLQAVDGRLAGATYPEIAEVLFGAGRVRAVSWKSLSLRDTTMRRVRDGFRLVNSGYRGLLRHRRPCS